MAWQYLLRFRLFDVAWTTWNVCMRQPAVHAIQLYDIIPAKQKKRNENQLKLNFDEKLKLKLDYFMVYFGIVNFVRERDGGDR